jgi:hypothetical protein
MVMKLQLGERREEKRREEKRRGIKALSQSFS